MGLGRLNGKRVIITGGARGMGATHAEFLADEGAAVVIGDILDEEGRETAATLTGRGLNVRYEHLDVTDEDSWHAVVDRTVADLGGVDGLVNNAGVTGTPGGPEVEDLAAWNATLAVNQTGAYLGIRVVAPAMRAAGGGSIVNISSILGYIGDGVYFAYAATKGALRLMSRSAALKFVDDSIRVNSVCPGMVRTPMNDAEVDADSYVTNTPMRRMADPVEVSRAVLFLLSDEASYVTGSDLVIDGGYLAR
ncbi:MAG: glucose 1-dehydrogenase [Actinobacteria bacterium]|nr:glucose 1-dehydrogenase [Actinomycetota bacterium]